MQVITDFLCEAWRTLTDSFAIKALLAVVAEVGIYMLGLKHVQVLGIFQLHGEKGLYPPSICVNLL